MPSTTEAHVELRLGDLAASRVDDRRLLARVVDEGLFPGAMHLAHRDRQLLPPRRVQIAKLAVLIGPRPIASLPRTLLVLRPEKLQRHPRTPKLTVHPLVA